MTHRIVFITGSPSSSSRSSRVAHAVAAHLEHAGIATPFFSIQDFDPADVLFGRSDSPAVASFLDVVRGAAGIVLATPVYKATYAGGLKALVDLLPHDGLVGKATLGIATTRLASHGAEVDRAYRALFAFFRSKPIDSLVVLDDELRAEGGVEARSSVIDGAVAVRVAAAAHDLIRDIQREARTVAEAP